MAKRLKYYWTKFLGAESDVMLHRSQDYVGDPETKNVTPVPDVL